MFKSKSKLIFAVMVMFGITAFMSCEKESENKVYDENLIPEKLEFLKINEIPSLKTPVVIMTWDEWGRAKKDCDGWGLCNLVWFPERTKKSALNNSNFATLLKFDSNTNSYYIDILLSAPVPTDVPIESYPLKIDEAFDVYVGDSVDKNLIFNYGDYPFDESLGEFGGFRIYVN